MNYQLHELFWSIQGEGHHAGQTAVFVRLQGCPVGCAWCDAKLTWYAGGRRVSVEGLLAEVAALPRATWYVITGGEPLLYDLDPLLVGLGRLGTTQIETSGVYPFKGRRRPTWTTVSPKYPAGYAVARDVLEAAGELKYVVDEHLELAVVQDHLAQYTAPTTDNDRLGLGPGASVHGQRPWPLVYLMPEGSPPREAMVRRTLELLTQEPLFRFSPRLQYDYRAIGEGEGDTNQSLTVQQAREAARALAAMRRAAARAHVGRHDPQPPGPSRSRRAAPGPGAGETT